MLYTPVWLHKKFGGGNCSGNNFSPQVEIEQNRKLSIIIPKRRNEEIEKGKRRKGEEKLRTKEKDKKKKADEFTRLTLGNPLDINQAKRLISCLFPVDYEE